MSLSSLAFCISRKITKILSLLDELEKETTRMDKMRGRAVNVTAPRYSCNDNDLLDQTFVFEGRKDVEEKIVNALLSSNNAGGPIFTVAIVGMGGIGKTSLAKKVYKDQIILNHFAKKFWVTVGEVFDAAKILKEMLQSLGEVLPEDSSDSEAIFNKLAEFIMQEEKTLIVLDDVWSVNQEQLHKLYELHRGNNISILVTTRRKEAARTIGASNVYNLERLNEEESWDLFKLVAASADLMQEVDDFETIGREVVAKCHGVPLIIRNMGGLLQGKGNLLQWKTVAETRLRDLPCIEMLATLSVTYDRLSNAVKRCFAYCCIFPKGGTIRKSDLIRLWLAQGFLSEEAAEKYFDILVNELLFQVSVKDEDRNAVECTMTDLNHDLAMYVSMHEGLIFNDQEENQQSSSVANVQHLLISSGVIVEEAQRESHFRLRTMYSMVEFNAVQETILSQARYMYVLKLDGIGLKEVPKSIDKLKLLRYLDLSNNPIRYLPENITHLYLLQTLLAVNCEGLEQPHGLITLTNLTLVDLSPLQLSNQMIPPTARRKQALIKLNELEGSKKISELGDLNDISGPLSITSLDSLGNTEAAREAKIGSKHSLSALELHWNRERLETGDSQHNLDADILEALQPHPNIRRLKLINYDSQKFPMWVMKMKGEGNERLNKLVKIELVNCKRCLQLPTMGQLPSLWTLIIDGINNIETIGQEFYNDADDSEEKDVLEVYFPFLRRLELRNFSSLTNWKPSTTTQVTDNNNISQAFPRLETLKVVNCPKLTSIPTDFPQIKSLMIQGVTWGKWLETIIKNSCKNHSLTSLILCDMVSEPNCFCNEIFQCTSLEELSFQNCKNLFKWPSKVWSLTSLKELCINDCPKLAESPRLDGLNALSTLVIRGCGNLNYAPKSLDKCSSLTKLAVTNCAVSELPKFQQLTSLEELDILDCVKLKALPEGLDQLTRLQTLRISEVCDKSDNFKQFPECQSLEKLERIWLKGTSNMKDLPQKLKCLPQLKVLRIWRFSSLETVPVWICDLKNLEILIFEECDTLKELPLRENMRKLKKLRCLRIEKCADLEERFEKGPEWAKIRHVSHIKIKGHWYQGDRRSALLQEITEPALDHGTTTLEDEEPNDGYYDAKKYQGIKALIFYMFYYIGKFGITLQSFSNYLQEKLDEY